MRNLLIALVAIISILAVMPVMGDHFPEHYTAAYNKGNLYADETLEYQFSDLSVDVQYTFRLQLLDPMTGVVTENFAEYIILPDASLEGSFTHGPFNWPQNHIGPFRVVDNFGQILGFHYLAPVPHSDWEESFGLNTADDKVIISSYRGFTNGPYQPLTAAPGKIADDANHHNFVSGPLSLTGPDAINENEWSTLSDDYALLHYNCVTDCVDEFVEIRDLDSGTQIANISLEEAAAFNIHRDWIDPPEDVAERYIIISTSGEYPPFVDPAQLDFAFTAFDDPHTVEADPGIYDYAKLDNVGTVLGVGESVWVINTHLGFEWLLSVRPSITEGRFQVATVKASNSAVWNDYIGQELFDTEQGLIEDTSFAFSPNTSYSYIVELPTGERNVEYKRTADAMNFGADPDDFQYLIIDMFEVTERAGIQESLQIVFDELEWNTTFGFIVAFMAILSMVFIGIRGQSLAVYGTIFIAVAFFFMFLDWFPLWIDILLSLSSVMIILALLRGARNEA